MASRKIFAFIFCSLLSPIIFSIPWLPNILEAILYRKYNYYDFHITSLSEFFVTVYEETFLGAAIFSFVLIFVPFQLIKDYAYKKGKNFSFLEKIGILSGIMALWILVFGLFTNIWTITNAVLVNAGI